MRHALALVLALTFVRGAARAADVVLVDPTQPPASRAADAAPDVGSVALEALPVQSILVSPTRRMAVIGGVRVSEGDRLFGAEVATIRPAEVVLRAPTGAVRLPLRRTAAKAPTRERDGGDR